MNYEVLQLIVAITISAIAIYAAIIISRVPPIDKSGDEK